MLFLDEPTAGLDPVVSREVHELIAALGRSRVTIFLTTHRLEEAERLCDRVAILNTTLRTIGRPDELREQLFAQALTIRTLTPLSDPGGRVRRAPGRRELAPGWRRCICRCRIGRRRRRPRDYPRARGCRCRRAEDRGAYHSLEDVYIELIDEDAEVARG